MGFLEAAMQRIRKVWNRQSRKGPVQTGNMGFGAFMVVCLLTGFLGCGPNAGRARDSDGGGGDADASLDGQVSFDAFGGPDSGPRDAEICDEVDFEIQALPPNLLIMLDRSGSMDESVPNTSLNRWEVAKEAIAQVTVDYEAVIRFGLATFSACEPGGCAPGTIQISIAIQNAGAINGFLGDTAGEGSQDGNQLNGQGLIQYLCDSGDPETNTGASLAAMMGEAALSDPDRENAILLITDGEESPACVDNGVDGPTAAGMLLAQNPSVKTYAVGFGGADMGEMQAVATAGGTGQPYLADQAQSLNGALQDIAGTMANCEYSLPGLDPQADTTKVNFYFDGVLVGYDQDCALGQGWTWTDATHTAVRFCTVACDQLKNNQVSEVSATFGCKTTPVE
jgi:hypothetical protein